MSNLKQVAELAFSCPHEKCRYKIKKYDSIKSLNMHWTKKHSSTTRLNIGNDNRVYVRTK